MRDVAHTNIFTVISVCYSRYISDLMTQTSVLNIHLSQSCQVKTMREYPVCSLNNVEPGRSAVAFPDWDSGNDSPSGLGPHT